MARKKLTSEDIIKAVEDHLRSIEDVIDIASIEPKAGPLEIGGKAVLDKNGNQITIDEISAAKALADKFEEMIDKHNQAVQDIAAAIDKALKDGKKTQYEFRGLRFDKNGNLMCGKTPVMVDGKEVNVSGELNHNALFHLGNNRVEEYQRYLMLQVQEKYVKSETNPDAPIEFPKDHIVTIAETTETVDGKDTRYVVVNQNKVSIIITDKAKNTETITITDFKRLQDAALIHSCQVLRPMVYQTYELWKKQQAKTITAEETTQYEDIRNKVEKEIGEKYLDQIITETGKYGFISSSYPIDNEIEKALHQKIQEDEEIMAKNKGTTEAINNETPTKPTQRKKVQNTDTAPIEKGPEGIEKDPKKNPGEETHDDPVTDAERTDVVENTAEVVEAKKDNLSDVANPTDAVVGDIKDVEPEDERKPEPTSHDGSADDRKPGDTDVKAAKIKAAKAKAQAFVETYVKTAAKSDAPIVLPDNEEVTIGFIQYGEKNAGVITINGKEVKIKKEGGKTSSFLKISKLSTKKEEQRTVLGYVQEIIDEQHNKPIREKKEAEERARREAEAADRAVVQGFFMGETRARGIVFTPGQLVTIGTQDTKDSKDVDNNQRVTVNGALVNVSPNKNPAYLRLQQDKETIPTKNNHIITQAQYEILKNMANEHNQQTIQMVQKAREFTQKGAAITEDENKEYADIKKDFEVNAELGEGALERIVKNVNAELAKNPEEAKKPEVVSKAIETQLNNEYHERAIRKVTAKFITSGIIALPEDKQVKIACATNQDILVNDSPIVIQKATSKKPEVHLQLQHGDQTDTTKCMTEDEFNLLQKEIIPHHNEQVEQERKRRETAIDDVVKAYKFHTTIKNKEERAEYKKLKDKITNDLGISKIKLTVTLEKINEILHNNDNIEKANDEATIRKVVRDQLLGQSMADAKAEAARKKEEAERKQAEEQQKKDDKAAKKVVDASDKTQRQAFDQHVHQKNNVQTQYTTADRQDFTDKQKATIRSRRVVADEGTKYISDDFTYSSILRPKFEQAIRDQVHAANDTQLDQFADQKAATFEHVYKRQYMEYILQHSDDTVGIEKIQITDEAIKKSFENYAEGEDLSPSATIIQNLDGVVYAKGWSVAGAERKDDKPRNYNTVVDSTQAQQFAKDVLTTVRRLKPDAQIKKVVADKGLEGLAELVNDTTAFKNLPVQEQAVAVQLVEIYQTRTITKPAEVAKRVKAKAKQEIDQKADQLIAGEDQKMINENVNHGVLVGVLQDIVTDYTAVHDTCKSILKQNVIADKKQTRIEPQFDFNREVNINDQNFISSSLKQIFDNVLSNSDKDKAAQERLQTRVEDLARYTMSLNEIVEDIKQYKEAANPTATPLQIRDIVQAEIDELKENPLSYISQEFRLKVEAHATLSIEMTAIMLDKVLTDKKFEEIKAAPKAREEQKVYLAVQKQENAVNGYVNATRVAKLYDAEIKAQAEIQFDVVEKSGWGDHYNALANKKLEELRAINPDAQLTDQQKLELLKEMYSELAMPKIQEVKGFSESGEPILGAIIDGPRDEFHARAAESIDALLQGKKAAYDNKRRAAEAVKKHCADSPNLKGVLDEDVRATAQELDRIRKAKNSAFNDRNIHIGRKLTDGERKDKQEITAANKAGKGGNSRARLNATAIDLVTRNAAKATDNADNFIKMYGKRPLATPLSVAFIKQRIKDLEKVIGRTSKESPIYLLLQEEIDANKTYLNQLSQLKQDKPSLRVARQEKKLLGAEEYKQNKQQQRRDYAQDLASATVEYREAVDRIHEEYRNAQDATNEYLANRINQPKTPKTQRVVNPEVTVNNPGESNPDVVSSPNEPIKGATPGVTQKRVEELFNRMNDGSRPRKQGNPEQKDNVTLNNGRQQGQPEQPEQPEPRKEEHKDRQYTALGHLSDDMKKLVELWAKILAARSGVPAKKEEKEEVKEAEQINTRDNPLQFGEDGKLTQASKEDLAFTQIEDHIITAKEIVALTVATPEARQETLKAMKLTEEAYNNIVDNITKTYKPGTERKEAIEKLRAELADYDHLTTGTKEQIAAARQAYAEKAGNTMDGLYGAIDQLYPATLQGKTAGSAEVDDKVSSAAMTTVQAAFNSHLKQIETPEAVITNDTVVKPGVEPTRTPEDDAIIKQLQAQNAEQQATINSLLEQVKRLSATVTATRSEDMGAYGFAGAPIMTPRGTDLVTAIQLEQALRERDEAIRQLTEERRRSATNSADVLAGLGIGSTPTGGYRVVNYAKLADGLGLVDVSEITKLREENAKLKEQLAAEKERADNAENDLATSQFIVNKLEKEKAELEEKNKEQEQTIYDLQKEVRQAKTETERAGNEEDKANKQAQANLKAWIEAQQDISRLKEQIKKLSAAEAQNTELERLTKLADKDGKYSTKSQIVELTEGGTRISEASMRDIIFGAIVQEFVDALTDKGVDTSDISKLTEKQQNVIRKFQHLANGTPEEVAEGRKKFEEDAQDLYTSIGKEVRDRATMEILAMHQAKETGAVSESGELTVGGLLASTSANIQGIKTRTVRVLHDQINEVAPSLPDQINAHNGDTLHNSGRRA